MLTDDQIEELRNLQKELRAQGEIAGDAWQTWIADFENVATEVRKYNELLKDARDIATNAGVYSSGELSDYETEIDLTEPAFDEADTIDGIIEEETVSC